MNRYTYLIFRMIPYLRILYYKYWNRIYFLLLGIKYGKSLNVYNKVYIIGCGNIQIGNNFKFSSGSSLNAISRNICGTLYTSTKDAIIEIGDNVGISSACLWAKEKIKIGNNVNIGGDSIIIDNDAHPHNHIKRRYAYLKENGKKMYNMNIPTSPIMIDDDVWIGARCQILKGVHIGARSIVAAGSVVVKDIPSGEIWGGNPAHFIKKIDSL